MKLSALLFASILAVGSLFAQDVVISEFLADNAGTLEDEDGAASDWIEIYNPGPGSVSLLNWALTDTPADLFKWRFPATPLPGGGFLVVFASEKNRTNAGAPLHTNFKLDGTGEYLALVRPDGSIAQEFSPVYPEQKQNTSYGLGFSSAGATLVPLGVTARALVPSNNSLGLTWTQVAFDDSGWLGGTTGVGYDNNTAGVDYNPLLGLNVGAPMFNRNASVYVRVPFVVTNAVDLLALTLRLQYEDGVILYLNGVELARNNAPDAATYNSTALTVRPDETAVVFATLDLTAFKGGLQLGTNVLAFHGLNQASNSSDLLIRPELTGTYRGATTGIGYLARPTPGSANTVSYPSFVRDTRFSHDRGFYETNFSLVLTCATTGATIYYTTNGSAPSPTNGAAYAAPIPVSRTTAVRAAAYAPDALPSDVDSQTYIFLRDVMAQPASPPGFPANWGSVSADYAMDPRIVTNALYTGSLSNDLRSLPVLSLVLDNADMFGPNGIYANSEAAGDAWERPTSVEYFDPSQPDRQFHINAGVQILGSSQRTPAIKKHGLRVTFKTSYGLNKLRFPLYPGTSVQKFNNLSLFPGGHDGCAFNTDIPQRFTWPYGQATFARARWLFQSQLDTGQAGVHGDFVHLYINGLYWGHYRLNERPDASYAADYFGGENEEYDALKHSSPIGSTGQPNQYELISGTTNAWVEMYALATAGLAGETQFQAIQQYLDLDSFIDYLLVNLVCGNLDWPDKNWYGTRRRVPGAGFKFYCWDGEIILGLEDPSVDRTGVNGANTPGFIYSQLRANSEFRRMFGDHVQRHMFNDGAMTVEAMQARFGAITNYIERSIVPESARWGDVSFFHPPPNTVLYARETHWRPECGRIMTDIIPLRWSVSLQQFRAAGLFPTLSAPILNQHGGSVPAGFSLALANPNASGVVFFTLDGSDPRVYGSGAVASTAQAYALPVTLNATTFVRARVKDGTNWSALTEAVFYTPQDFTKLLVTEIMYNPPAFGAVSGDEFEFLELKNAGTNTLDLSGLYLHRRHHLHLHQRHAAGARRSSSCWAAIAARFADASIPGVAVHGVYTGKLDNGGETLTLSHPLGRHGLLRHL